MTSSVEIAREIRSADRVPAAAPRDPVIATLWSRLAAYQTFLLAAILIVVLAALVLPPFVFLLKASVVDVQSGGEWSLANFEAVLGSRRFLAISANSLVFAAGSAVLALAIGWTTAWIVERTNTPLKPLAYLTAIISLGTPYILYVTAWLLLFGKAGPVNQLYRSVTGNLRHSDRRLFHVRHDPGRGLPVVAAGVPPGGRDAAQRQSGVGGSRAHERRRHLDDHPAGDLAALAAVHPGAGDAGLHPRHRGVRSSGAGGAAGPHLRSDHRHLRQHGGKGAPRYRRRQRALGPDARAGVGAARHLRPAVAARGEIRDRHRQGLPAAPVRPRAAALRDGGDSRVQFPAAAGRADRDARLGFAAPVLSARQRGGAGPRHSRQLSHRVLARSCRADRQHAAGRGRDRDAGGGAHLPGGMAGGAAGAGRLARRAAGYHPAGLSRPHSRHRGDAALSAFADPALRHAGNPDLGVRHQLPALRNALQRRRHAADPSRARGVGGDVRRLSA